MRYLYSPLILIVLLMQNVSLCDNKLIELKNTMLKGPISQRRQAIKELKNYTNNIEAFNIAALEFNNDNSDLIRLTTDVVCTIHPILAKELLVKKIISVPEDVRIKIYFGLSDRSDSIALNIVDSCATINEREKTVTAYIHCVLKDNYDDNYRFLITTLLNKKMYTKGTLMQQNACIDAASFLGKLGDKHAIKALKQASKWADAYFGEEIMHSIYLLDKKKNK